METPPRAGPGPASAVLAFAALFGAAGIAGFVVHGRRATDDAVGAKAEPSKAAPVVQEAVATAPPAPESDPFDFDIDFAPTTPAVDPVPAVPVPAEPAPAEVAPVTSPARKPYRREHVSPEELADIWAEIRATQVTGQMAEIMKLLKRGGPTTPAERRALRVYGALVGTGTEQTEVAPLSSHESARWASLFGQRGPELPLAVRRRVLEAWDAPTADTAPSPTPPQRLETASYEQLVLMWQALFGWRAGDDDWVEFAEPEPLRLAWPVPSSAKVHEVLESGGRVTEKRYTVRLVAAPAPGELLFKTGRLEAYRVDGLDLLDPANAGRVAPSLMAELRMEPNDVRLDATGAVLEVVDYERYVDDVIAAFRSRGDDATRLAELKQGLLGPFRAATEASLWNTWACWVGVWCGERPRYGSESSRPTTMNLLGAEVPGTLSIYHKGSSPQLPGQVVLAREAVFDVTKEQMRVMALRASRDGTLPDGELEGFRKVRETTVVTDLATLRPGAVRFRIEDQLGDDPPQVKTTTFNIEWEAAAQETSGLGVGPVRLGATREALAGRLAGFRATGDVEATATAAIAGHAARQDLRFQHEGRLSLAMVAFDEMLTIEAVKDLVGAEWGDPGPKREWLGDSAYVWDLPGGWIVIVDVPLATIQLIARD